MDDELTAFDFPDLIQVSNISFGDPISLNSIENTSTESINIADAESESIGKIHEYLDKDIADQDILLRKLLDFETTLNQHIKSPQ